MLTGLVVAVAACVADSAVQIMGPDPVIIVHDFSYGMQMRLDATLAYDSQSKCLKLNFHSGPSTIPVWPAGTRPPKCFPSGRDHTVFIISPDDPISSSSARQN
ncbi:hypothetical protein [Nonomuraea sp. NEAU-A123]|uniref:hypothetical protein n=1 Tax=Nonomuraea sp. NEAU-A123 TaxID=2839649 RepID=UPI001BE41F9B|nr:hypothetical protein [Nonomuraea sp. NEAU-A123]MBT2231749.1 hypothetical protein [Nonomuraea sp. NEAU-A123]